MNTKNTDKTARSIKKQLDEYCRGQGCVNVGDEVEVTIEYFDAKDFIEAYEVLRTMQKQTKELLAAAEALGEISRELR